MRFNNNPSIEWSTNGVWSTNNPYKADVQTVAVHEFGHWIDLWDTDVSDFNGAVMYGLLANKQIKVILTPYDQEGVTVNYHF